MIEMKTSDLTVPVENGRIEETPKNVINGRIIKSMLVVIMISCAMLLNSCMVAFPRGPHPPRHGAVIEMDDHGGHHDNGKHKGQR
jgi:hypothetical protein